MNSEDEKIRKEIILHLQHEYVVKRYVSDVEYDRWIAWLEKQGKSSGQIHYVLTRDEDKDIAKALNVLAEHYFAEPEEE